MNLSFASENGTVIADTNNPHEFYPVSYPINAGLTDINGKYDRKIGVEDEFIAFGKGDLIAEHIKNKGYNADVVNDSGHIELRTKPWAINMLPDSPEAMYFEMQRMIDFYTVFQAADELGVPLMLDCIDPITREAAGLHMRIDKNGNIEDEAILINAAQANEYLFSALSNLDNNKRVEKFGFEYRIGKDGDISDKARKKCNILIDDNTGPYGSIELRYIPMSDNLDVAYRMPDYVGAYFTYMDMSPAEKERNRILANESNIELSGETYAKVNRDRTLKYGLSAKVFEVAFDEAGNIRLDESGKPAIMEIPLLEAMKYSYSNILSGGFMNYSTASIMHDRLEKYDDLFEFLNDVDVQKYVLDSGFSGKYTGFGG